MAKLIEFYVPANFQLSNKQWTPDRLSRDYLSMRAKGSMHAKGPYRWSATNLARHDIHQHRPHLARRWATVDTS